MKHKFKLTRLWVASLLLFLGISPNVWGVNWNFVQGDVIYFDCTNWTGDNAKIQVNVYGTNDAYWKTVDPVLVYGNIYKWTVDGDCRGFQVKRCNPSTGEQWNYTKTSFGKDRADNDVYGLVVGDCQNDKSMTWQKVTIFNVSTPQTEKCYLAGNFNSWSFAEMNRESSTQFLFIWFGYKSDLAYKYSASNSWDKEELTADAKKMNNRTTSYKDITNTVANWKPIYCLNHDWEGNGSWYMKILNKQSDEAWTITTTYVSGGYNWNDYNETLSENYVEPQLIGKPVTGDICLIVFNPSTKSITVTNLMHTASTSVTGGIGGTLTINDKTSEKIQEGNTYSVVATAATGYKIKALKKGSTTINAATGQTSYEYNTTMEESDVTYSVEYEQIDYSITYDPATAEHCTYSVKPTSAHYNESVSMTITPDDGYTVTSVSTTPTTTVNQSDNVFSFTMPASNVTVTIVTSLSKVNVTSGVHSSGNGQLTVSPEPDANGKVDAGANVTFTADPNDGYKVVGFYSNALCSNENLLQAGTTEGSNETYTIEKISAAATVYVKFAPITYNITYNETHSVTHSNPDTYTIETETITFTNPTTDRTGYDFAGWSPATISKGSYGNQDVTANWTAHTYSVAFDKNDNEAEGSMETETGFVYDQSKALTTCGFTKQGYTFAGWATTSGGEVAYANNANVSNLTTDNNATVTLYAKWNKASFTLNLIVKSASTSITDVEKGTQVTLEASSSLDYELNLAHFNYEYKVDGGDYQTIASQTGNSTTWTPTNSGNYTLKVTYTDGNLNVSKEISFIVWGTYTIYIWDDDNYAKRVHIYNNAGPVHNWDSENERMTAISEWGTGWYKFDIQYPLYNKFKVHLDSNSSDANAQSQEYLLTKEPNNLYLRCWNKSDKNWEWDEHSISAPEAPSVSITATEIYATKMVVTVHYSSNRSVLTAHSLKIDGETKTIDNFNVADGGDYEFTLNNLIQSTDHTFEVSATNALGEDSKKEVISTKAKEPIRYLIKVSSDLMKDGEYGGRRLWGKDNPTKKIGIYYWSTTGAGFTHNETLDYISDQGGGYYVYEIIFEDSPCAFYVYNYVAGQGASGTDRSAEWLDANSDGCALVQNDLDGNDNHKLATQQYCTTQYQLVYTNSSNYKTYSNIIGDKDEILSLFVAPGGTLEMMQYDPAQAKWNETPVFTTTKRPATAGVYNLSLVNVDNFDITLTEANLSDFEPYTGKYYIRTDVATGGWESYLAANVDNAMTEFTPRRDKGEDFSYYWVKNVAKNGTVRVSACVGNDYNPDLANMLKVDEFVRTGDDGHGYIDKLTNGANVRFSYEPTTNEFKRAVIGGSGANDFLNVYSNDNNVYATKSNEGALSDLLDDTQNENQISKFNDVSDWVYEKVVYVQVASIESAASVILQSKFNSQTNHLLGYELDGTTPKQLEVFGAGTNPNTYTIRITYDYKKNRLMASWEPGTMPISTTQSINTDILFIQREHKGGENDNANGTIDNVDVAQITYTQDGIEADAKLTSLKNIMYVLEVTPQVIKGTAADNQEYWITLPFDCRVSDVFGVEDYVKLDANGNAISGTWGIMRYDGATRASHGWFKDDYSTFWRWMTRDETMHAGEGYVVIFDKTNASSWPSINVDGENKQVKRLYFPSMTTGFTISYSKENSSVEYSNNPCSVEGRENLDNNWKVLGPKSYNNIEVDDNTVENNLTYYYTYDQARKSGQRYVEHTVATESKLKAFHSYMSQFGGTLTWKPFTKSDPASSPLYASAVSEFKGGMLTVELNNAQGEQLDRTFVNLHKNGTLGFDQNMELTKIEENCAQIASVNEDVLYAGSTLPLDIELVPLNVKVVANGSYDIALEKSLEGLEVNLFDAFEQTTTPLDMMSATVTLNKGEYKDRFYLQLKQKSGETPTSFEGKIEQFNLPTDKTQKLLINGNIYLINGGRVYNATGTMVK